ncbi:hypothetical protein ACOSQ3_014217 [Xanthoceras sorbifolium]
MLERVTIPVSYWSRDAQLAHALASFASAKVHVPAYWGTTTPKCVVPSRQALAHCQTQQFWRNLTSRT